MTWLEVIKYISYREYDKNVPTGERRAVNEEQQLARVGYVGSVSSPLFTSE